MYEILKQNLHRTVGYEIPEAELDAFCEMFFPKKVERKSLLTDIGQVCKYLYFINQGSAYMYYLNEKGEKTAIQFGIESYWVTDLYSFLTGKPGLYTVEVLEDCELLMFNHNHYEKALDTIPFVDRYFRILTQNAYVAQQYRLAKTNSESAEHRYQEFVELFPHFVQRIPQYLIASYLGIKPQSLSRIRRNIVS
ncbi:MAG: Crp/Fnr family transcriptional regulator [Flavobacteriaceae bacterium]|nr:Crp/Fnr family transcriptional regulator [Flavobacteriaceae bacterium]